MTRYIDQISIELPPPVEPSKELLILLTKLVTYYPPRITYPKHELHGLYSGPTLIALLFFYILKHQPELLIKDRKPHRWCQLYFSYGTPPSNVDPAYCGVANETLLYFAVATISDMMGTDDGVEAFLNHIPALISSTTNTSPASSNEWLYGRAGTLYLLRLLR